MIFILCFIRGIKVSRYKHTHESVNMQETKGSISSTVILEVIYL